MEQHLDILRRCPLFRGIEDGDLTKMLTCLGARVGEFDKKYTILAEGTRAKYIGIMLSGSAQIVRNDYYGNRSILSEIAAPDVFGEAFACAELPAIPASVIANEPSVVMLIDCGHILHTCGNNCGFHQQLIFNLMKDLAEKTLLFHQKIEITAQRTTRDKLMTYLMLRAKKEGSSSFEIPFDRLELADYLEVDRSGLSAEIGKLRREGIIDCEKNRFRLL